MTLLAEERLVGQVILTDDGEKAVIGGRILRLLKEIEEVLPPATYDEPVEVAHAPLTDADGFVIQPVIVIGDLLIDGFFRIRCAAEQGLRVRVVFLDEEEATIEQAKHLRVEFQLGRRNLPKRIRAILAVRYEYLYTEAARQRRLSGKALDPRAKTSQGSDRGAALRISANRFGVSHQLAKEAKRLLTLGSRELTEAVWQGKISVGSAFALLQHDHEIQRLVVSRLIAEPETRPAEVLERVFGEIHTAAEGRVNGAASGLIPANQVIKGGFRCHLSQFPDGIASCVIVRRPNRPEFPVDDRETLFAATRILSDSGILICVPNDTNISATIRHFSSGLLFEGFCFSSLRESPCVAAPDRRLDLCQQPVLVFRKGEQKRITIPAETTFDLGSLLEAVTTPGDLVVELFMDTEDSRKSVTSCGRCFLGFQDCGTEEDSPQAIPAKPESGEAA